MIEIILELLKEIDPITVQTSVKKELILAYRKEQNRREREAARKRRYRLCQKILKAPTPEEAARIKAEHYSGLSAEEIEKVENKLREMQWEIDWGPKIF